MPEKEMANLRGDYLREVTVQRRGDYEMANLRGDYLREVTA
jgi:hypothetical protein